MIPFSRAAPWLLTSLAAFLVVGILLHSARLQGRAEARALARERAVQDQVTVLRAQLEAGAAREAEAQAHIRQLEAVRQQLTDTLRSARQRAQIARALADSVLAQMALSGDTLRGRLLRDAVTVIGAEGPACAAVLQNCETRVQTQALRAQDLGQQLLQARALMDTLQLAYRDAARAARPNLVRDLWRSKAVTVPVLAACTALAVLR